MTSQPNILVMEATTSPLREPGVNRNGPTQHGFHPHALKPSSLKTMSIEPPRSLVKSCLKLPTRLSLCTEAPEV